MSKKMIERDDFSAFLDSLYPKKETPAERPDAVTALAPQGEVSIMGDNYDGRHLDVTENESAKEATPVVDALANTPAADNLRHDLTMQGFDRLNKTLKQLPKFEIPKINTSMSTVENPLKEMQEGVTEAKDLAESIVDPAMAAEGAKMEQEFANYAKELVGENEEVALENLSKVEDGTISFGDYNVPEEVAVDLMNKYNGEIRHHKRFREDASYRNDWMLKKTGKSEKEYRTIVADNLEAKLNAIEEKAKKAQSLARHNMQTPRGVGGYAALGASANKPTKSNAGMLLDQVADAREIVKTLRNNSFWSGLDEGFDIDGVLTLGFAGVGRDITTLKALNKANKGEKLTSEEEAIVDLWTLKNDAENEIEVLGGRSGWASLGQGIGQSVEFIAPMALTGGLAGAAQAGVGLTRAAASAALKRATSKGVSAAIKNGLNRGAIEVGKSVVGATARMPLFGQTYKGYTERRLGQFSRNLDDTIDKASTPIWKDALHAGIDNFSEIVSEDFGVLLDLGFDKMGMDIVRDKIVKAFGLSRLPKAYKNQVLEFVKDNARISSLAGEVGSEAFGDAMANTLKGDDKGWRQMATWDYWWNLVGVSAALSGGFSAISRVANSSTAIGYNRQLKALDKIRIGALDNIVDETLKKQLQSAAWEKGLAERSRKLASIDWKNKNYTKQDVANALDFINAQTRTDILTGAAEETRRLEMLLPTIQHITDAEFGGSGEILLVTDKEGNAHIARDYDNDSKTFTLYGEKKTLSNNDVVDKESIPIAECIAKEYNNMFRVQEQQEQIEKVVKASAEAIRAGFSGEEVADMVRGTGLTVYKQGDEVELLNGSKVVVNKVDGIDYEVVDENGNIYKVAFEEVLQPSKEVAEAQVAKVTPTETTTEVEAVEGEVVTDPRPEVQTARSEARLEAEDVKNVTDGKVYEATMLDDEGEPIPVHIIEGRIAGLNAEDGSFDKDASDASIIVRMPNGERKKVAISSIDSIDDVLEVQEYSNLAGETVKAAMDTVEADADAVAEAAVEQTKEDNNDGYKLSQEVDENGRQFVLSSSGDIKFGDISEESSLTPAPILLSEGMITNKATNDGYGLVHIEARHGDQIRNAGYKSVVDFVEDVARNYEVIKEGNVRDGNNTYLLQVTDKRNNTLMVELSGDGTYWNINTAGIFKTSYGKNRKEVYNRHTTAKQPAETDEALRNAEPSGTQANPSMITPTLDSSASKYNTSESKNQEVSEKNIAEPAIPTLKDGTPDYNAMSPEQFVANYVESFGEMNAANISRNNIKAADKEIAKLGKEISALTDPNKLPKLKDKLDKELARKARYETILDLLGVSIEAEETDADRKARLKKESTPRIAQMFPDGLPNVESVILADIATGSKIRWGDKVVNGVSVSKGLGNELGLSDSSAERNRRIGLISKDAPTPEEYAEQLPERLNAMGIRYDESELRDKVIDAYASVDTRGAAWKALENIAEVQNEQEELLDYEEEQMRRAYEKENRNAQTQPAEDAQIEEALVDTDEVPFSISNEQLQEDSDAAQLATEAAVMALKDAGVEVIEATQGMVEEALQRRDIRMQTVEQQMSVLQKAERFIRNGLTRGARGSVFRIPLPDVVERKIRNAMGRDFDSHNITINSIVHALRNHEVNGTKLTSNSIALTEEDATLIPYIMFAPDRVEKATTDASGRESVRFYKGLSNGYVVVVEKEYKNSPDDMETITMWAEISPKATNARQAAAPDTHARNAILSTDAAKIRKDAENAIRNDVNLRFQQQSAIDAEYFDAINAGDMELAQKLVREYAESRGYHLFGDFRDAHAAPSSSVDRPDFTNAELINQQSLDEGWDVNLFAIPQGENLAPNDFWSPMGPRWYMYGNKAGMETHAVINSAIRSIMSQLREYGEVRNMPTVKVYRAVPTSVVVESLENGDWVTPSLTYATTHGLARFGEGDFRIIEQDVPATDLWWDGNDAREWGYDNGNVEAYANTPNHVKVLDPITRDDAGNIIPLSVRFDSSIDDPRFSIGPAPVFVSNAKIAVMGIKQEKATPEQWLKMIEKNGGLKAGEDKWLRLSDWLKDSDKKTLTKQEVLDYINENQIQIEEVKYSEFGPGLIDEATRKLESEMRRIGIEAMRDKYPDFDDYFEVIDGELVWSENNASEGEYEDYIIYNEIVDVDPSQQGINESRLSYTTQGLTNKREIALTVPTIEPWNEGDQIHFGDAGEGRAIAWIRFGDTTDEYGFRVLVIDEIQSKRHQEGRERGYAADVTEEQVKKAREEADVAYRMFESFDEQMAQKYGTRFWSDQGTNEEYAHWELLRSEYDRYGRIYEELYDKRRKSIPAAPFEKNWAELAMKRMLRYAAENGYDAIAWTKGDQQAERYSLGAVLQGLKAYKTSPNTYYVIPYNNGAIGEFVKEYTEKELADTFGKELAVKIIANTEGATEDNPYEIEGDNLRIGGEGMKGFYDQILPSFMNKYGKKWGVKVQDVILPFVEEAGRTMHSVEVTDAMRESVMEGQPMFYRRPNGVVYGWTNGKTVYLTKEGMNPNTPIHEYTHIWADAMMARNRKGWDSIVKLIKGTPIWNEVMADKNYARIRTDEDQVVAEALSRISGKNGATKMEQMAERVLSENGGDSVKQSRVRKLIDRMRKALQEFWSWVGKELFGIERFDSIEEIADRVLYDLVSGTDLGRFELRPSSYMVAGERGAENSDKVFIHKYDDAFAEIENEYHALDKNNEQELKAWRAKKLDLVERYITSMSENLAMPTTPIVFDATDVVSSKKAYDMLPEEARSKGTLDEFMEEAAKMSGFYLHNSNLSMYNISKDDTFNNPREWLGILAHENGHKAAEVIGISDSDKRELWEICKQTTTELRELIEDDYETDEERGEEYLMHCIQSRAKYRRLGDLFAEYILGEKTVGDVVKSFKDSLPLRDELAEKILNYFRDGYRKARGSKEYFAGGEQISESIKRGGDRYWSGYSRSESHSDGSGGALGDAEPNIKEPTDKELRDEVRGELNAQREEKALRSAEAAAERAHKQTEAAVKKLANSRNALERLDKTLQRLSRQLAKAKADDTTVAKAIKLALENEAKAHSLSEFIDINSTIEELIEGATRGKVRASLDTLKRRVAKARIAAREADLNEVMGVQLQKTNSMGIPIAGRVDDTARVMLEHFRKYYRLSPDKFKETLEKNDLSIDGVDADTLMKWHSAMIEVDYLRTILNDIEADIARLRTDSRSYHAMAKKLDELGKHNEAEMARRNRKMAIEVRRKKEAEHLEDMQSLAKLLDDLVVGMSNRIAIGVSERIGKSKIDTKYAKEFLTAAIREVSEGLQTTFDEGKSDAALKRQKNWETLRDIRMHQYPSFEFMVKQIAVNAVYGEGFLYRELIEGDNGWVACRDRNINYDKSDEELTLDTLKHLGFETLNQAANFFDQQLVDAEGNPFFLEYNTDKAGRVGHEEVPMTIGYAVYLKAMRDQSGIAPTLDKMNLKDEYLNKIFALLDLPQNGGGKALRMLNFFVETLSERRNERYNPASLERYGVQMANIENYFPVRRLTKDLATRGVDMDAMADLYEGDTKIYATALIQRVKTYATIDFKQNPLKLFMAHLTQMNHFAAFAPLCRNLEILLNSKAFENHLKAQKGIGHGLNTFDNFKKSAILAVGRMNDTPNALNKAISAINGLAAGAKISLRMHTALKQILSLPAGWGYSPTWAYKRIFLKNVMRGVWDAVTATPRKAGALKSYRSMWEFCYENIPTYKVRWDDKCAGNENLKAYEASWIARFIENHALLRGTFGWMKKVGMLANALVDQFTCSIIAYSIYEYEYQRYKSEEGKSDAEAKKLALRRAMIGFNTTQQSSEDAFLSPSQRFRDVFSINVSLFANSNRGYGRKARIAQEFLWSEAFDKNRRKKRRDVLIRELTAQYRKEAIDELLAQNELIEDVDKRMSQEEINKRVDDRSAEFAIRAQNAADVKISRARRQAAEEWFVYKLLLNYLWLVSPALAKSLVVSDDDDEESLNGYSVTQMLSNLASSYFMNGVGGSTIQSVMEGFTITSTMLDAELGKLTDSAVKIFEGLTDEDPYFDSTAFNSALSAITSGGLGFDFRTFLNMYDGVMGVINDSSLDNEDVLRFLNSPKQIIEAASIPIEEGENEHDYVRRQALMMRISNEDVDGIYNSYRDLLTREEKGYKRKLDKWSKNYIEMRKAKMLGEKYEKLRNGSIVVPYLEDLDDRYTKMLFEARLNRGGGWRSDIKELSPLDRARKEQISNENYRMRVRKVQRMENNLEDLLIDEEAYEETLKALVAEKEALTTEWFKTTK